MAFWTSYCVVIDAWRLCSGPCMVCYVQADTQACMGLVMKYGHGIPDMAVAIVFWTED